MINLESLSQINKIIEHDKISSTYKFALLKNTIDVVQRYDHIIIKDHDYVTIPVGLIVEGWIFDYFPFVFNDIRQQNCGNILNKDIEKLYHEVFLSLNIDKTKTIWNDAYAKLYFNYLNLELNEKQSKLLFKLAKKILYTIKNMPMKYLGDTNYEIFKPDNLSLGSIKLNGYFNKEFLIKNFGSFKIKKDHYYIFRYIGQCLYGSSTIARRWKETTYKFNENKLVADDIDTIIYKTIFANRNTNIARKHLPDNCYCVWSGKKLKNNSYDIDHVLPYSIWFNNDLWNLLPCNSTVNSKKSNKIPSPELILKQREIIIDYWNIYENKAPELFKYQISSSLGNTNLKKDIIQSLCEKANYLIESRGLQAFNL